MSRMQHIQFHLVDDNDIDIAVNTKLLQIADISPNIRAYNSAVKFLEEVNANSAHFSTGDHVILLDIMMPRINGFECLDELEKMSDDIKSHLTVFMLSSTIDRNDIRRAETHELVQKVLEKPLDIYILKKGLENLFE
jgi:CheY-like chemotaxis protein